VVGRSSTPKPSFGDVFNTDLYPGVVNTQAPLKLTVTAINPNTGLPQTGTVKIQNLGVNENGKFVAIDARVTEIPVDETIADQIQKAIGEDEYPSDKIRARKCPDIRHTKQHIARRW
jgi:hypothetical protein